jgi:hypothetical protein
MNAALLISGVNLAEVLSAARRARLPSEPGRWASRIRCLLVRLRIGLCGSRFTLRGDPTVIGMLVAFHPAGSRDPKDVFLSNQLKEHSQGGIIELVIVHPDHWSDPRPYFADLRAFGAKLR